MVKTTKYVERPPQIEAIQFHGDEDFDDEELELWLKQRGLVGRIVTPLMPPSKPWEPGVILELKQVNYTGRNHTYPVREGFWIVLRDRKVEVYNDADFHDVFMEVSSE